MLNLNNARTVLSSVNYTDLPIIGIFIYHIIEFIIALNIYKTRFNRTIMFAYCIIFYAYGDTIQDYCKLNYSKLRFSRDYFDKQKTFLFLFIQLPTIMAGLVLVYGLLTDYIDAYAKPKKQQVKSNEKIDELKNEEKSKND